MLFTEQSMTPHGSLTPADAPLIEAEILFRQPGPALGTSDPVRLKRPGVPVEHRAARTKPKIALAEIDKAHSRACCRRVPYELARFERSRIFDLNGEVRAGNGSPGKED